MIVQFENQQRKYSAESLQDAVGKTMHGVWEKHLSAFRWYPKKAEVGVTVHFVGRKRMREVNRETRGIDRVTDVLSFPMLDTTDGRMNGKLTDADVDRTDEERPVVWLGDVLICPGVACRQADAYGHSMIRETAFLAGHGMLHLLGYDHDLPGREKRMTDCLEQVLLELGYTRVNTVGNGDMII